MSILGLPYSACHDPQVLGHLDLAAAVGVAAEGEHRRYRGWQGRSDAAIFGACSWRPDFSAERCPMECKQTKNLKQCTCSYDSCSRKGRCCECVSYRQQIEKLKKSVPIPKDVHDVKSLVAQGPSPTSLWMRTVSRRLPPS